MTDTPGRGTLLRWALALAPASEQGWLEEMASEAEFVPRGLERLRWGWGALGLALRWRLARAGRGGQLALATALTAALVAVLVSVPGAPSGYPGEARIQPSPPPSVGENAFDQGMAARQAEAPRPAAAEPSAAEVRAAAPAERAPGFAPPAESDNFALREPAFALRARRPVSLTLTDGSQPGEVRTLQAGERLELRAPVTVTTADAGALELLVGGSSEGLLGADGEALERRFTAGE